MRNASASRVKTPPLDLLPGDTRVKNSWGDPCSTSYTTTVNIYHITSPTNTKERHKDIPGEIPVLQAPPPQWTHTIQYITSPSSTKEHHKDIPREIPVLQAQPPQWTHTIHHITSPTERHKDIPGAIPVLKAPPPQWTHTICHITSPTTTVDTHTPPYKPHQHQVTPQGHHHSNPTVNTTSRW